jgi:hypothetical protein
MEVLIPLWKNVIQRASNRDRFEGRTLHEPVAG